MTISWCVYVCAHLVFTKRTMKIDKRTVPPRYTHTQTKWKLYAYWGVDFPNWPGLSLTFKLFAGGYQFFTQTQKLLKVAVNLIEQSIKDILSCILINNI